MEQKRGRGRPKKLEEGGNGSFYAPTECLEKLKALAASTGKTKGEIICEALKQYIPEEPQGKPE